VGSIFVSTWPKMCAPEKLFGGDVNVRTLEGHDTVAGELGHEPEDECALLCDTVDCIVREEERQH
jgi:hypothetical protein